MRASSNTVQLAPLDADTDGKPLEEDRPMIWKTP